MILLLDLCMIVPYISRFYYSYTTIMEQFNNTLMEQFNSTVIE